MLGTEDAKMSVTIPEMMVEGNHAPSGISEAN